MYLSANVNQQSMDCMGTSIKSLCVCWMVKLTVPAVGHIWTECLSQQSLLCPSLAPHCLWPHVSSWSNTHTIKTCTQHQHKINQHVLLCTK